MNSYPLGDDSSTEGGEDTRQARFSPVGPSLPLGQYEDHRPVRSPRIGGRARRRTTTTSSTSSSLHQPALDDRSNSQPPAAGTAFRYSSRHHHNHHNHMGFRRREQSPSSVFGLSYLVASSAANNTGGADGTNQPPLPSLRVIAKELSIICSLYMRYAWRSLKRPCNRTRRVFCYVILRIILCLLLLLGWCVLNFYRDSTNICTAPTNVMGGEGDAITGNPLVEYYVHGRGIGHYARSIAIVDQLNEAGVDVRMFLSRASMWRAMHEDSKLITQKRERKGSTTAISITSLTPSMSIFSTISHIMERIIGDCEVSVQHNKYPALVVSDGDLPGMLRAKLGGIPSVGIAHGQLFHIAQTPTWITDNALLSVSWQRQASLNFRSSFFSEWQIATHFCFLESAVGSGTVARAPMRPEVLDMARARRHSQRRGELAPLIPRESQVKHLLLDSLTPPNPFNASHIGNTTTATATSIKRRQLVICYFRDHNGAVVTRALLQAGFDVLLFDNGYFKDMLSDPNRYGAKWIVHNHDEVRKAQGIPYPDETPQNIKRGREKRRRLQEQNSAYGQGQSHELLADEETLGVPRLIRVMDRSMFVPLMHVADGVASSAGSQLMSECIFAEMPLLAHYLESDDEQRLNVELSRHTDSSCQKPHVYGSSFETLITATAKDGGLRGLNSAAARNREAGNQLVYRQTSTNETVTAPLMRTPRDDLKGLRRVWDEFDHFVEAVQASKVSASFYRYYESHSTVSEVIQPRNASKDYSGDPIDLLLPDEKEDGHLHGLPEAADIILEIIKRVREGR